jgi:hypothetical protein
MIDYVYGQDEIVAHAVAQMIPDCRVRGFGPCKAIGVIDESGTLIAGIVYHNYHPEAGVIEMSLAALPNAQWRTRETLRRMYAYPFEQIGVQMVMHMTAASDERVLRQLATIGYMLVTVPRLLGRDRDGVLCLFTREAWEECKFIRRPAVDEHREAA